MKVGFFITARLKSSRLKQKILLDLNGKPVLDRIIERCKAVKGIDGVVLCTSTNPQDSALNNNALKNQIQFYLGDEDDVLQRLETAALYYGYGAFLSITADNPLFSIKSAQLVLDQFRVDEPDFIFTKGMPIGCCVTGLKTNALRVANVMKEDTDTEIWGPFVNRSDFFSITEIHFQNSPFKEEKRLTIDYTEDYELLQKVYSNYEMDAIPETEDVLTYLEEQPELWEINKGRKQKYPSEDEIKRITQAFDDNWQKGKDFAKSIGNPLQPNKKVITISNKT